MDGAGGEGSMGVRGDGSTVLSRVIHTRCALLHRVKDKRTDIGVLTAYYLMGQD